MSWHTCIHDALQQSFRVSPGSGRHLLEAKDGGDLGVCLEARHIEVFVPRGCTSQGGTSLPHLRTEGSHSRQVQSVARGEDVAGTQEMASEHSPPGVCKGPRE